MAAMEEPQFRWLLGSNLAFFLALQGQILSRTYLAWELTADEMALAYVNIAFAIPMLVFSFVGGAISDRSERRLLALIGQATIVCTEASILIQLLRGSLEFWHILAAGAVGGAVLPFSMPARTAMVFNIVGAHRLGNATALSGAVMNVSRVAGPVVMGFTIDIWSITGAYFVAVTLHSVALLFLFGVKRYTVIQTVKRKFTADIVLGFRYVFERKELAACLLFGMLPMFLAMPFQNLLVVFADEVWQVGERGLGILMAAAGLGGVIGSVWMAQRGEDTKRTGLMVVSTFLFGFFLAGFALTPSFLLALLPLVIANICASAGQTLNNTCTQLLVEDQYRGRISAIMLMTFGLMPLGVVPLAYLASEFGVQTAILIASLTLCSVVIAFYVISPKLRMLDKYVANSVILHDEEQAGSQ